MLVIGSILALAIQAPDMNVDSETFDLTAWLDPNNWNCLSPDGSERLNIHYMSDGKPALQVDHWKEGQKLPPLQSDCGPDELAGSSTTIGLTSDLCGSWWLQLKLDAGTTDRAVLDFGWRGQEYKAFRCEKVTMPDTE